MVRNYSVAVLSLSLAACMTSLSPYSKPSDLLFQKKDTVKTQVIHVSRDNKLCANDNENRQTCPIGFFVDDFKAGNFYINNQADFYLKPDSYVIKVKSCKTKCETYQLKINLHDPYQNKNFKISIDSNDKPFITQVNTKK
ncbi:hypothetical protein [Acinetobacter ihumii]|uniref:hypothetical protein n=1 Tax=Acinetobacter ihumii TaxID=2483802 RepID=UPI0010313FE7|nr:hypothetical protein [Acinetobacter ihumii]